MKRDSRVETYLRQATRGLWGRKRREVREELALHLSERTTAHRIAGLSEREAEERALRELGAPQMVSTGMARIYTLPAVMGSSFALIALCLTVVALWPKGVAQTLEGSFYWPSIACVNATIETKLSRCFSVADEFWIPQKELRSVLEPQGVVFRKRFGPAVELMSMTVPGASPVFVPLRSSEGSAETIHVDGEMFTLSPGYVSLWNIVERFALNQGAQLKISGWKNPIIQLNKVSFSLQDERDSIYGHEFFNSYLGAVFYEGFAPNLWGAYESLNSWYPQDLPFSGAKTTLNDLAQQQVYLDVESKKDDVYGLITHIESSDEFANRSFGKENDTRKDGTFLLQVLRMAEAGQLNFRFPEQNAVTFIESFGYGDMLKPGDSILVRLAGSDAQGKGWYEVVSPEMITLEPSP